MYADFIGDLIEHFKVLNFMFNSFWGFLGVALTVDFSSGWPEGPDPDLEESLLETVEGVLFNNSFQFVDRMVGWSQDLFDRVGGPGTLRELWRRLKVLRQVSGLKRKLSSSMSSIELESDASEASELLNASLNEHNTADWIEQASELIRRLGLSDRSSESEVVNVSSLRDDYGLDRSMLDEYDDEI